MRAQQMAFLKSDDLGVRPYPFTERRKSRYVTPELRSAGRIIAKDPIEIRVIDIICSFVLLCLFAPIMAIIAISVFIANPGPVIFKQKRIGRYGRMFDCYKFRTMAVDAEARLEKLLASDPKAREEWEKDHKLKNDPRIVGIGNFLRKSSLDELPQFLNVLKGEMSLVGPRPIVLAEKEKYGRYISYYCSVRPGITGLWQVSGRNDVSYRRRVAFDVIFAKDGKIFDYFKILVMTLPSVVASKGSY